jgi:putative thioredoxin
LTATDFQINVIEASRKRPVLVDFWAPWCGPCRILGPVLEKLAAENRGKWDLVKVNTDENPAVASRYRVSSIPAVKLFVDGEVVDEFVGALPEARVRQWLDAALPSENKKRLAAASEALDRGDDAAALSLVDSVLAAEPDNPDALILSARLRLFEDPVRAQSEARRAAAAKAPLIPTAEAIETLARLLDLRAHHDRLPEGPGKAAFLAAIEALSRRDLHAAAENFIASIRADRRYNDDAARKGAIALFNLLGDKHPVTQQHRRSFQMAVF